MIIELQTNQLGCTNLLKELITKLWVGNSKMFCKLASEGLLLALGSSPHECSNISVTPIIYICLVIVLSGRLVSGLSNLLLQGASNDKHLHEFKHNGKTINISVELNEEI